MTTQDNPRDLVFATVFPDWHPKAGHPTYFAGQLLNAVGDLTDVDVSQYVEKMTWVSNVNFIPKGDWRMENLKIHTARKGHDWKVGDWFRPVTPDGVQIAPAMQVTWVRDVQVEQDLDGFEQVYLNNAPIPNNEKAQMAANDGLDIEDFIAWFSREPFDGQLIGWTADPYANL